MTVCAWLEALVVPVSTDTFIADAFLLAAVDLLAVGVVGLGSGWLVPTAVVGLCSIPGLVPWDWNWLYRTDREGHLVIAGLLLAAIAVAAFATGGSRGTLAPASRLGTLSQADEPT